MAKHEKRYYTHIWCFCRCAVFTYLENRLPVVQNTKQLLPTNRHDIQACTIMITIRQSFLNWKKSSEIHYTFTENSIFLMCLPTRTFLSFHLYTSKVIWSRHLLEDHGANYNDFSVILSEINIFKLHLKQSPERCKKFKKRSIRIQ